MVVLLSACAKQHCPRGSLLQVVEIRPLDCSSPDCLAEGEKYRKGHLCLIMLLTDALTQEG